MEAKDTVILRAIQEAYNRPDLTVDHVSEQDRVVFKAGMNKVVEWVNEQIAEMDRTGYYPKREMWQAQKKKWGIDYLPC